jgi:hypothetical protein
MNSTAPILQCEQCLRFFVAGAVVGLSIGEQASAARAQQIEPLAGCELADCADIKRARLAREKAHAQRFNRPPAARAERRKGKAMCRTAQANYRSPLPPEYETDAVEPLPVLPFAAPQNPAQKQAEFVASGQAHSAYSKLAEFFWAQIKAGKLLEWKSSLWLEDYSRTARAGSSRMNNRAVDLREVDAAKRLTGKRFGFTGGGYWIDQCSDETVTGIKGSAYCVCFIEDAHSLTPEEKSKLLAQMETGE